MKSRDRLLAVDSSAAAWQKVVPEFASEDLTLMRLLRVASLGITACSDPLLGRFGLTESSYHTLIIVLASGSGGMTPSTLCEQVGQTRANMTRILDLLTTAGYVQVRVDPHDARRKRIAITAKGRRIVHVSANEVAPMVRLAMSGLGKEQKRRASDLLRTLISSMDEVERRLSRDAG